jgi:hypothetical protein
MYACSLFVIAVVWFTSKPRLVSPSQKSEVVASTLPAASSSAIPLNNSSSSAAALTLGVQTKTANCAATGVYPDFSCSPGAVLDVTKDQICISGYSSSVRNVPESEKSDVYAEYGITSHATGQYEVDHLVSLELGGSNDISNLWPEPANPRPGFHEKDAVENYLHSQVCSGKIALPQAQYEIAHDWLQIYEQIGNPAGSGTP